MESIMGPATAAASGEAVAGVANGSRSRRWSTDFLGFMENELKT